MLAARTNSVRDAKGKKFEQIPPFPTFYPPENDQLQPTWAKSYRDSSILDPLSDEVRELIKQSYGYENMAPLREEAEDEVGRRTVVRAKPLMEDNE